MVRPGFESWLYLTIVLDLLSRQIIGWSMKNHPKVDMVIDAQPRPSGDVSLKVVF